MNLSQSLVCQLVTFITVQVMPSVRCTPSTHWRDMEYSSILKERLKKNAIEISSKCGFDGIERKSAFIFECLEMNFHTKSFRNIQSNDKWQKRTQKKHSHFVDGILEMQSSNSSDALLMNIFCYPGLKKWKGIQKLLNFDQTEEFQFGWNPKFDNENRQYPTEIDLKIGNRIFEAKLTESSFTSKSKDVIRSYPDFESVFNEEILTLPNGMISNYQLVRNILAAYKYDYNFTVIIDSSRIDLLREITKIIKSIRLDDLRKRIDFITWQEITGKLGNDLKSYISEKYF